MKTDTIVLGLAAIAVYLIINNQAGAVASKNKDFVNEILDTGGKLFSNGWRYFADGTAIDPSGDYYSGGALVYSNPNPNTREQIGT